MDTSLNDMIQTYFQKPITSSMASIPAYSDFGKTTKDVIFGSKTGLFQFDQRVNLAGKSTDGLAYNIFGLNKGDKVSMEAKGTFKQDNLAVDTAVNSSGQVKTNVSYQNITPGLKLGMSGTLPDISSAKLSADYVMKYLNLKSSLGLTTTPKVELAASTAYKGYQFGFDIGYDSALTDIYKWSTAVGYATSEWSGVVMFTDKGETIKAQVAHNMSSQSVAAAEVQQNLSTSTTTFTIGYQTKLENGALVKVKMNNLGILAMLYEHSLVPQTKVAACCQLDVTDLEKAPKYGFSVDISN
eukprot:TRINITY_DN32996_c0_g1_i1.p1 TRINITY_DN32996_c0_g1~~TRINITY_DN32996_c0_g1_i1.p1  ORF type:complete len:298 (-),score=29.22 TRINITY_DN32996_c0_g1_i1:191-1084(-)